MNQVKENTEILVIQKEQHKKIQNQIEQLILNEEQNKVFLEMNQLVNKSFAQQQLLLQQSIDNINRVKLAIELAQQDQNTIDMLKNEIAKAYKQIEELKLQNVVI